MSSTRSRADATPTDEEITRIRRLVKRIEADVGDLDDTEQARIDDAVAIVCCHRAAHTVRSACPPYLLQQPLRRIPHDHHCDVE